MDNIAHYIKANDIKPEQCRYDKDGIYLGTCFFDSANPKLLFAKTLGLFNVRNIMYQRSNSFVHERTVYDERKVSMGFNNVIGGTGFGYLQDENGQLIQMPHLGFVEIEDNVIIHNNTCIDRAVLGKTFIGSGTRIDNNVHVAHNVQIGKNCLIVAGSVLGGSCVIGDNTFIGINASIKNKVKIGKYVTIGMSCVVTKNIPDYAVVIGNPGKVIGWQNEKGERLHFNDEKMAKDSKGFMYELSELGDSVIRVCNADYEN